MIEIDCPRPDCEGVAALKLEEVLVRGKVRCPRCGADFQLPPEIGQSLRLLAELKEAVSRAEPILGRASVAVTTAGGEVAIPYRILLGRMTTELALEIPEVGAIRVRVLPGTVG